MNKFDFNKYTNVEDCINYDGFIAPGGEFYRVSVCNKHKPTHNEWADKFVLEKSDYVKELTRASGSFLYTMSRLKSKLEILMHFYGYIYYGHNLHDRAPIIIYPNSNINNKEVSTMQYNMLFDILYERDELMYLPVMALEEVKDKNHDKYVDDFINKRFGGL